jgi:ABC-type amino acid transport substrate-binding protein
MKRRLPPFFIAIALAVVAAEARAQGGKAGKPWVYVGDADFEPYDFLDANGRPTGFNVELVRALARDAGVEVEIRLGHWNEVRADFDAGRADLISLTYSEERGQAYLWLARTWTMQQCLFFRPRPRAYPASLADLTGEAIAVQERSAVSEMLLALPEHRPSVINVSTQAEALRLLQAGAATGVGGNALSLGVVARRLSRALRPHGRQGSGGRALLGPGEHGPPS